MSSSDDERRRCPYVGLQPFEEADREFFFGREREQRIIISNLLASPLTILYGASGVGKSSVLMAGVLPQMRRERPKTPVVIFRNWVDAEFQSTLTRACIEAVWKHGIDQPKPAETLPFDEVLRACSEAAHGTILIILDQFEEYFLYHGKSADPGSFEAGLACAVNREDVDAGFLISLRDDALSKLDRFQERIPHLLSNRLHVEHLGETGARAAIRRPLEVWNDKHAQDSPPMRIEEELVDELIRQVRTGQVLAGRHGGSGKVLEETGCIEAPFLQLVLVRLWEEEVRTGSNVLQRQTLERLKGAEEIVRTHLVDVMSGLKESQAVCASFFDRLVTPTGSKVACSKGDFIGWAGELAPKVPEVLKPLLDNRILRTVAASPENPEETRYEIYHDVLAPAVLEWRRRYVDDQERVRAVQEAREEAKKRALRKWLALLAAMTVLAVTGWMVASWQALRSEANQKATEAIYTAPFDSIRALDLALKAVESTASFSLSPIRAARHGSPPTEAAENALRQVIQASRLEWSLQIGSWVSDLAFSPDGNLLATAGRDGWVKIWDISTGHPKSTQLAFEHPTWVRDVIFVPGSKRLLTVAEDTAYLWSLEDSKKPLRSFVHGVPIYTAVAVSSDGSLAATAGSGDAKGRAIKVWDLAAPSPNPEPVHTIDTGGAWAMGLAFSPDGHYLATACVEQGGADRVATSIWSIKTGREILRVPNEEASDAVVFTPDGKSLVTASRDSRVRLWRPVGEELDSLLAMRSETAAVEEQSSSSMLSNVRWLERILAGHGERVRDIAVSSDGSRIASAGGDDTAKIWDTETGENLLTLAGHKGFVEAVRFSPDGHHVATASVDRTVKFWNIDGHTNSVNCVAFSPDGTTLATGSSDRTARLWNLAGGTPRLTYTLKGHEDQIYRLAFDPTGSLLATAGFDRTLRLWNVVSGRERDTLKQHSDQLRGVAFSHDGRHLTSVGADGQIFLYDLKSSDPQGTAVHWAHNERAPWTQISAVSFEPGLDRLATGGWDGVVRLWDISGKEVGTIEASESGSESPGRITDISFSPDGKVIAVLFRRWVYLWPVESFEYPNSRPSGIISIEGAGYCSSIAYSHGGGQFAVACNDAAVRIYDTSNNELVKTITVHKSGVSDVEFSPDGTKLATSSLDKTFHVSPLHFGELYETACRLRAATSGEQP